MSGETLNDTQRADVLRQAMASETDRQEFASTWAALIQEVLPYESSVRNIFAIERLAPGTTPLYQLDIQPFSAWIMPKMGSIPMNLVEMEEITIPTFEVVGSVYYKMRDAEQGRINIVDRAMMRLMDSIVEFEETSGWPVLRALSETDVNRVVLPGTETFLNKPLLDKAFSVMERERGYEVTDIYLNSYRLGDVRSWTQTTIDPTTQREIFVNAGLPSIYGARLHVLNTLADDEVYLFDLSGNNGPIGYMPIRKDLATYEDPTAIKELRVGVLAYEEIGFAGMDHKCVVKIDLSSIS